MTPLAVLSGLLGLLRVVVGYFQTRRLLEAGAATQVAANLKEAQDALLRAQSARRAVRHDADSVRNDPDNRD